MPNNENFTEKLFYNGNVYLRQGTTKETSRSHGNDIAQSVNDSKCNGIAEEKTDGSDDAHDHAEDETGDEAFNSSAPAQSRTVHDSSQSRIFLLLLPAQSPTQLIHSFFSLWNKITSSGVFRDLFVTGFIVNIFKFWKISKHNVNKTRGKGSWKKTPKGVKKIEIE